MSFLTSLPPELIHAIALSGHLTPSDVSSLALTCTTMASILTHDGYAHTLHRALLGVLANVSARHWKAARYAATRRWFGCGGEEGEEMWREVARKVVGVGRRNVLRNEDDLCGWENVILALLALDGARGWAERWGFVLYGSERKTSLLHVAANVGSERVASWVLERGGALELGDYRRVTPLWEACLMGRLNVVRAMVDWGGTGVVEKERNLNKSVFVAACKSGHVELVRYLWGLSVFDVEGEDYDGETPLGVVCDHGHLGLVDVLVEEAGADVDVEGRKGTLYRACYGGKAEVVRRMIELGSGLGVEKDEEGGVWVRGLMAAAEYGFVDVVRVLLEAGVGVDVVGREAGETALSLASAEGYLGVVRELVGQWGADVDKVGRRGRTPLLWACARANQDVVRVLVEEGGADVGIVDPDGETALDVALRKGLDGIIDIICGSDTIAKSSGQPKRDRVVGGEAAAGRRR